MLGVLTPLLVTDLRQLNIRLDTELAEQLKGMAAAEGLSLNQLIRARFESRCRAGACSAGDGAGEVGRDRAPA